MRNDTNETTELGSEEREDLTDEQFIEAAQLRRKYGGEEIDIDAGAVVIRGSEPGAWVAAWVWVSCEEAANV